MSGIKKQGCFLVLQKLLLSQKLNQLHHWIKLDKCQILKSMNVMQRSVNTNFKYKKKMMYLLNYAPLSPGHIKSEWNRNAIEFQRLLKTHKS